MKNNLLKIIRMCLIKAFKGGKAAFSVLPPYLTKRALRSTSLIIFLLSVLFYSGAYAQQINVTRDFKPFKMAFVPDVHLSVDEQDDWILYNESLVIFQDVIKTLNKTPNIDFIVFGGDLIQNNDKKLNDMSLFLDTVSEIKFPYYVILGDREADLAEEFFKQDICAEFRLNGFLDREKTYWVVEPVNNIILIGLDTSQSNNPSGLLSAEQLSWLDSTLKSNPDKFTVITMHHSALPSCAQDINPQWRKFLIENSGEFLNIVRRHPQVKLVLSGHHHLNSVKRINNTIFMNLPSIVTYPNQFKLLTVYPDRVEVDSKKVSFKQIIKKAKKTISNTDYARQYDNKKPVNILKLQTGDDFSNKKKFYFSAN